MKRYSTSQIIREMQIKATIRYHFTHVRRTIMKKTCYNECWWGSKEKGIVKTLLVGMHIAHSHYGKQYGGSSESQKRTAIRSSNPTPGHMSRQNYNSKTQAPLCSQQPRHGNNLNFHQQKHGHRRYSVCIYKWNSTQLKKEWNNAICSNMEGPRDYHARRNDLARERQIPYDIAYR